MLNRINKPALAFMLSLAMITVLATNISSAADNLAQRADVISFINSMVKKHQFQRQELTELFTQARFHQKIIDAITRPAESKPWYEYRPIFLGDNRIRGGVDFLKNNRAVLQRAEDEYGVPAEIITAIIGVETFYGRHKGGYRVMDSLTTLGFDYPKRAAFFRGELEEFLLMAREEKLDPLSVMGSYAGAMGQPQFIPSSFRSYAIDFDDDGKRDLWQNTADVIGSISNYFKRHGWIRGEPIASPATVSGTHIKALVDRGLKPHSSIKALQRQGVHPVDPLPAKTKAALIELEQKNGNEYWLGMNNFYVITRYNHSPLYAMAVFQLGQEIDKLRGERHPGS